MKTLVVVIGMLVGFPCFSQNAKPVKRPIKLSGVVITGDENIKPIPGTSIKILKTDSMDYSYFFSVVSDDNGSFVIMTRPGDVVGFKKEGYLEAKYTVPDTIKTKAYSIMQILNSKDGVSDTTQTSKK